MIERVIDRPMPRPSGFVVKKGSKTRDRVSGGSPAPVSEMVTLTVSGAGAVVRIVSRRSGGSVGFHRLDGVAHQVQQGLLQLDGISRHAGHARAQVQDHLDLLVNHVGMEKGEGLADDVVGVRGTQQRRTSLHERSHPLDDFARRVCA